MPGPKDGPGNLLPFSTSLSSQQRSNHSECHYLVSGPGPFLGLRVYSLGGSWSSADTGILIVVMIILIVITIMTTIITCQFYSFWELSGSRLMRLDSAG